MIECERSPLTTPQPGSVCLEGEKCVLMWRGETNEVGDSVELKVI